MPLDPAQLELLLNRAGQNFQQAGQQAINQNIDEPAQARLRAMQQASASAGQQMGDGMPSTPAPSGFTPPMPQVEQLPGNAPSMTQPDQNSRMNAMIQGPQDMANAAAKLRAQAAMDQQHEEMLNHLGEDTQAPAAALRQFPQIQQRVASKQPVTTQDIRSMTSPTEALTPEQEAKINSNLSGKDEDEE